MQQFIAGTTLSAQTRLYAVGDYDVGFKKSKPTAKPLVTHQFVGYKLADTEQPFPVTVSCKLKTAERIRTAYAEGDGRGEDPPLAAEEDRTCQQWTAALLDAVYEDLQRATDGEGEEVAETALTRESIRLEDEDNVYIGPLWVRAFPYQPAYQESSVLVLRSKALHAEYSRWIPMPDSFMGTHYCHSIAPEYLRALVLGEVRAPTAP
ncbi:hypothetical protein PVT68_00735 [Microbulbifer bruguierae]|uniref:Uncharacterized protein n=1 Tax=Microbulbifer bruguierae TaxID=3029061 RepID=A0ABY8ND46_9GAMM|nr:hypothetical protein [Microbulbifer bruguierae]WGL16841.1 hypothetical protein PVT68_00735 [Microbulbifer bruguierae]